MNGGEWTSLTDALDLAEAMKEPLLFSEWACEEGWGQKGVEFMPGGGGIRCQLHVRRLCARGEPRDVSPFEPPCADHVAQVPPCHETVKYVVLAKADWMESGEVPRLS